jgi:hypothetical protein
MSAAVPKFPLLRAAYFVVVPVADANKSCRTANTCELRRSGVCIFEWRSSTNRPVRYPALLALVDPESGQIR